MKNKKRVLGLSVIAILAAIALLSGSLAYFTDSDKVTNTFVVGDALNVKTEEKQRTPEGGLTDFDQTAEKILMPVTSDVVNPEGNGLVQGVENYMDKIVYVSNSSETTAYVRTFIAVPAALVAAETPILHFDSNTAKWTFDKTGDVVVRYNTVIEGMDYVVFCATYQDAIGNKSGCDLTTDYVLKGIYLDKNTDTTDGGDGKDYLSINGNVSTFPAGNTVKVYVATQAVQADGFTDAVTALNTAFGANSNTNLPTFA